ncbi:hypothetical protein FOZ61_004823 [Perkinsus olseni]|uniref:Uncharacterized protein n=2 Tax=Perkinsus olseni TaxID=32597 RepID=A0A7J6LYE5_PEROL|nr:hypothetical protein FOZ61_004823 [Perkinsus olseni]KAF4664000.1 hypothetical protein FOL46_004469 [Perkinsus olseni]
MEKKNNERYAYVYGTANRSYVGLYFDYIQNASQPEGRVVYNCGTDAGRPDGLVEFSDGLIQFVSPSSCHFGATELLKSVVAREKQAPPGLKVLTRLNGDREVLAFLPTFAKDGVDADLQFFVNDREETNTPWGRSSQWYSSPEHSTVHGIYCSQSEYLMLVDVPFAYPPTYDPWDLTGPMVAPVSLDMTKQGGLVVQLNSESTSSLTALKRVDLPLNNPSAESFSGDSSRGYGPSTIVDFEGFPFAATGPGNVTGVSMFETLRCQYESAVSSLLDCSFSYTTDSEPFSRVAQFSRSACSDMNGNNVWSHMAHSRDLSMGYPKIAEANSGYYDDYCIKEFEEGRLVWSMSMRPLECRNTDLKGKAQQAYMVLRGVPNVAWYLYGTYPSAMDCNSNADWDGSIFQQVQQDCNSREGNWVCVVQGACTIEVYPRPRTDLSWVAYVVVIIVVAIVATSLLIRALCSRDGLTSAGAVLDAKSSGGVVTLTGESQPARHHRRHDDSLGQSRPLRRSPKNSSPGMHFDMPAEKVAKVVAAAKAKMHGDDYGGASLNGQASESEFVEQSRKRSIRIVAVA